MKTLHQYNANYVELEFFVLISKINVMQLNITIPEIKN